MNLRGAGTIGMLAVVAAAWVLAAPHVARGEAPFRGLRCTQTGGVDAKSLRYCLCPCGMKAGSDADGYGICVADSLGKCAVRVDSAPSGATVYLERKELGAVGVTPWEAKLAKGSHTLIVELDGYERAEATVAVVAAFGRQDVFMPMVKYDPPRIDVRADADANVFGADVFLDGAGQGKAPMVITTTPGRHLLELKKEGYESFLLWQEAKINTRVPVAPVLKAVAKPKYGIIVVEADVPDAVVLLDGNVVQGTTPVIITDVVEGLHVVEVRKPPSLPWKQTVQVTAGGQPKVRGRLKASAGGQTGSIRMLSNVPGAKVFLDGIEMGAVPLDIKDVEVGEHLVEVKAPGYHVHDERISLAAGQAAVWKIDLDPEAPKVNVATLKVVSALPEAEVLIDGVAIGTVPREKQVTAGDHYVVVKRPGFKTFTQKIRLKGGQTLTVSADLYAVGRLRIVSVPPGADVMVNGVSVGTTPIDLQEVEVGATYIAVQKEGYRKWRETLDMEGGGNEIRLANLQVVGQSEDERADEQRGLSSFGARALPRGRSTVDLGLGYPHFVDTKVTVGAGTLSGYAFDAGMGVHTFGSRSEIGVAARLTMADGDRFAAALFGDLWWGSALFDDSKRNGVTFDAGAVASLTTPGHVTVSGRLYLQLFSDRHCPERVSGVLEGQPIDICEAYNDALNGMDGASSAADRARAVELTGQSGANFFTRDGGVRLMASAIVEVALEQRWNGWLVFEGAPFQSQRALFTDLFSGPMLATDYAAYIRVGATCKF